MHNSGDDNTNATIQQEASLALSVCEDTRRITEDERLDTDDACTRYNTKYGPSGLSNCIRNSGIDITIVAIQREGYSG